MNVKQIDPGRSADQKRNHLENGFEFAPFVRRDDDSLVGRQHPQSGHHELPCQHHDDDPARHQLVLRHHHKGPHNEDLVRQRIHQTPEVAFQMKFPGQIPVQKIRERRENRHNVGDNMADLCTLHTHGRNEESDAVRPDVRKRHKNENQQNSAQRDPVRKIFQIG